MIRSPARFALAAAALVSLPAIAEAQVTDAPAPSAAPASAAPVGSIAVDTSGDDSPNAQTITLAFTIARARANPPAVLLALAQLHAAEVQITQARIPLLPTLTGNLAAAVSGSTGPTVSLLGTPSQSQYASASIDASLSERWTIWDFGRTRLNVRAAEESARGARGDWHSAERNAIAQAAAAYYAVLADQELVASLLETVRQRARELEITAGLVEAGARPPIERLRGEITLAAARLDVSTSRASLLNDVAALAAALALDPARPLRLVQPAEFGIDDDPAHAADAAVSVRPEIAAAQARVSSAEVGLRGARALYRPSVYLNGAISGGAVGFENANASGTGGLAGPRASGNASLGLAVPVFDPTISPNVRAAEVQLDGARATLAQQILAVRTDAVQAAIAVRSARQALAQSEQLASMAAANLQQAEGRYRAGAAPLLELVDAQASDATARLAAVRARFQFELAKVRLLTSLGRIDELEHRS